MAGCDVGKRSANTVGRETRKCSLPELRAAKEASNVDENCLRDSAVHSVRGSAGVSFAGTMSDTS